jgi:branched-subunit amino acid transport protein
MSHLPLILGMAAVTFASRYAGLAARIEPSAFWQKFLALVPITMFAGIVATSVAGDGSQTPGRLSAAALAGVATFATKRLWVGMAVGLGALALFVWGALF